jgi:hypothetical protein
MHVTSSGLTKAAGAAAAAAGAIFIGVQINHPPMVVSSVDTTEWALRNTAKVVMAALALVGVTGMYLRQVRQVGLLGLVGYLLFSAGYLVILSIAFLSAYVLPSLVDTSPGYVQDLLTAAEGGTPVDDIGLMQGAFLASAVGYMLGGLVFGIALFRSGVLARWAAALLAVSTVGTAALAVLPDSFNRPIAVPEGIALIGLGISLWRTQRNSVTTATTTASATAVVEQPAVR